MFTICVMIVLRVLLIVLAIIHLLLVGIGVVAGLFADGSDDWSRIVVLALHPAGALAIILLAFLPNPPNLIILSAIALLTINIIADASLATLIATGALKGDWWLPMLFIVTPAIAMIYAPLQLRTARAPLQNH